MATTTDKINYAATSSAFTSTLNSLASSSNAGRGGVPINNYTNAYVDVLVNVNINTSTGTIGNDKAVYCYVALSADGAVFNTTGNESAVTTDAACNIDVSSTNMRVFPITVTNSSRTYNAQFTIAAFNGGVMPVAWAIATQNFTGVSLAAAGNSITYTPIYYTNS